MKIRPLVLGRSWALSHGLGEGVRVGGGSGVEDGVGVRHHRTVAVGVRVGGTITVGVMRASGG